MPPYDLPLEQRSDAFESNFPVDKSTASYAVTWNAFKRTVSGASADEKRALFSGTAARVYKIDI